MNKTQIIREINGENHYIDIPEGYYIVTLGKARPGDLCYKPSSRGWGQPMRESYDKLYAHGYFCLIRKKGHTKIIG